jgi:transcription elongation factor Elf1
MAKASDKTMTETPSKHKTDATQIHCPFCRTEYSASTTVAQRLLGEEGVRWIYYVMCASASCPANGIGQTVLSHRQP